MSIPDWKQDICFHGTPLDIPLQQTGWEFGSGVGFVQPKTVGLLTSNKEGKVICEIDGWVLGGVQFGALLQELFWDAVWGACRRTFARLTAGCSGSAVWGAVRGAGAGD